MTEKTVGSRFPLPIFWTVSLGALWMTSVTTFGLFRPSLPAFAQDNTKQEAPASAPDQDLLASATKVLECLRQNNPKEALTHLKAIQKLAAEQEPKTAEGWVALGYAFKLLMADACDRALKLGNLSKDKTKFAKESLAWVFPPASAAGKGRVGKVGDVRTPKALALITGDPAYSTVWVHCRLDQFTTSAIRDLQAWVESGHKLVVETDLAQVFGFQVIELTAGARMAGVAKLVAPADSHPLIQNVTQVEAGFQDVGPEKAYASLGHKAGVALLAKPSLQGALAVLAIAPYGKGILLFRSSCISDRKYDGAILQANVNTFLRNFPEEE